MRLVRAALDPRSCSELAHDPRVCQGQTGCETLGYASSGQAKDKNCDDRDAGNEYGLAYERIECGASWARLARQPDLLAAQVVEPYAFADHFNPLSNECEGILGSVQLPHGALRRMEFEKEVA